MSYTIWTVVCRKCNPDVEDYHVLKKIDHLSVIRLCNLSLSVYHWDNQVCETFPSADGSFQTGARLTLTKARS